MDTNVFISQLKPDDPYHSEAIIVTRKLRKGEIQAETSVLTILETASVASRMYHRVIEGGRSRSSSYKEEEEDQDKRKMFVVKTLKMLTGLGIKFVHTAGDMPLTLGNTQTDAPSIFNESILLSIQTPFRTLDLMHVAAARHAKQKNSDLAAFVTGAVELLAMKEPLSRITGLPFLSPREYVQGLGLK